MNYPKLAFTQEVKNLQTANGSREAYRRMEETRESVGLGWRETQMIEDSDSFFIASVGENQYPYIQHRGGPKGFLKVLNSETLAFLDFTGNKQYITTGNIKTNNKVSLILMDYPNKARLKMYAEVEIKELNEDPGLTAKLNLDNYDYRPERVMVFHVKAFDWNCPQHITPRYSMEQIEEMYSEHLEYTANLEKELKELKSKMEI